MRPVDSGMRQQEGVWFVDEACVLLTWAVGVYLVRRPVNRRGRHPEQMEAGRWEQDETKAVLLVLEWEAGRGDGG